MELPDHAGGVNSPRHGYQTQAVGKMHVYPERSQMGFQNVILHDGYLHFARNQHRDHGQIDDYLPWLREQLGVEYRLYGSWRRLQRQCCPSMGQTRIHPPHHLGGFTID